MARVRVFLASSSNRSLLQNPPPGTRFLTSPPSTLSPIPSMRSPGSFSSPATRPGGGAAITITVCRGSDRHPVAVPAKSTFGDLKRVVAQETGLEPQEQRLVFKGKEKDDEEYLHMAGVKDMSKVALFKNPASMLLKLGQMRSNQRVTKASKAVDGVRIEVDKLCVRVSDLQAAVNGGRELVGKELDVSTELLMTQLLKLDGIEAEGEAKVQRKSEVRRIQSLVDTLDNLKARNSGIFNSSSNAVQVTNQWETFKSGIRSLIPPLSKRSSTA